MKEININKAMNLINIKDPETLVRTFEILPEYLKTQAKGVKNFRDWGLQLGRRFRALKLWFVIRNFGVEGLRRKVKFHIDLADSLRQKIEKESNFELLAPVPLNTICFRYNPPNVDDNEKLNRLNEELLHRLNRTGKLYMTHTKLNGKYTLRLVTGQTNVQEKHINHAWKLIQEQVQKL